MALLYGAVAVMMWPYPEMVARSGGGLAHVVRLTGALTLFTVIAGVATWALVKRRPLWWLGQIVLSIALVGLIVFVESQRQ